MPLSKRPVTREQHREWHQVLDKCLEELLADYSTFHPGKRLADTSVLELVKWSHDQRFEPDGEP